MPPLEWSSEHLPMYACFTVKIPRISGNVVGGILFCCMAHLHRGVLICRILWIGWGLCLMMKSQFLCEEWWYIHICTYTGRQDLEVPGFLFTYFHFFELWDDIYIIGKPCSH